MRLTRLPSTLSQSLEKEWVSFSLEKKRRLAEAVIELSTYFQDKSGKETPWSEHLSALAYQFYFFPLNIARAVSVFESLGPLIDRPFRSLFDIGSGLGNLTELQKIFPKLLEGEIRSIEKDPIHSDLKFEPHLPSEIPAQSTGFYSFSWVEIKTPIEELKKFEDLIFIEPSTSHVSRKLMALRQELIDHGFTVLAPCTHQKACPLLIHSQKDWCHDRVHFEKPDWFKELESLLPMRNDTLTFSYLVASRSRSPLAEGLTRVIGDTLKEKGKTRQAICFDDQRRFLSWLKRDYKNPQTLDHGSLVQIKDPEQKNSELRVTELTHIEEL
jgi:hypothetical protein